MKTACLLHLPDEVRRLDSCLRRIPGVQVLLGRGRFVGAVEDSRARTRSELRARGWSASEHPEPIHDLILTTDACPVAAIQRWLAPGGSLIVVAARDLPSGFVHSIPGSVGDRAMQEQWTLDARIDVLCVASLRDVEGLSSDRIHVTGDPRLDPVAEPHTAARVRAALGLSRDRRVVLVEADAVALEDSWATSIAALRAEADVVLVQPTLRDTRRRCRWPRVLTGPGLRVVPADGDLAFAELCTVADVFLTSNPRSVITAHRCAVPTLRLPTSERSRARFDTPRSCPVEVPEIDDPAHLLESLDDVVRAGRPTMDPLVDGRASARVAHLVRSRAARSELAPQRA